LWVSIKDLNQRHVSDTAEYISDEGVRKSNVKKVVKGTTLLSFKLTIGRVAVAGRDLYTNEAIAALIPNSSLSSKYLYYGLQFWDLLQSVDQAIKGATLNKAKLKQIGIFFPTALAEQEYIASKLWTTDKAIDEANSIIGKLTRIKQGLMRDLFTGGIDERGNIRSERTHKFKNSPLGRIPEEWDLVELGRINRVVVGYVGPIEQYYTNDSSRGVPLFSTTNIQNGGFTLNDKFVTEDFYRRNKKSQVKAGDIILARHGASGSVAVIPEYVERAQCLNVVVIKASAEMDSFFLSYLFNSSKFNRSLLVAKAGSVQGVINTKVIKTLFVYKPSIPEQHRISDRIKQVERAIEEEEKYKVKMEALRLGLMQDLLSGKVRVNHLIKQ
jgi:type I restriction enzyme, S subunit